MLPINSALTRRLESNFGRVGRSSEFINNLQQQEARRRHNLKLETQSLPMSGNARCGLGLFKFRTPMRTWKEALILYTCCPKLTLLDVPIEQVEPLRTLVKAGASAAHVFLIVDG